MVATVKAPSGRKIWKAVRDELMLNLYPLPFSTIAPTVYRESTSIPMTSRPSTASAHAWSGRSSRR